MSPLNLGSKNSLSLYSNVQCIVVSNQGFYSRPKTIDDVAAQEHTVSVLRKALTSTNVSLILALKQLLQFN